MNDETIARIVALWEEFKRTPFPDIKNPKYWTVRNWTSTKRRFRRSLKYQNEEIEWFALVSVYIDIDEHMRGLAGTGILSGKIPANLRMDDNGKTNSSANTSAC